MNERVNRLMNDEIEAARFELVRDVERARSLVSSAEMDLADAEIDLEEAELALEEFDEFEGNGL